MKTLAVSGIRFVLPLMLGALTGGGAAAQVRVPPAQPLSGRPVPKSIELSKLSPFALDERGPGFHILPEAKMSEQDRDLLAHSEASLRREAALHNVDFANPNWKHVQLDCPSFPHHLLLRFERNNGSRDVSIFSAAISRGKAGRVVVLPILRRSYSLFSPAARNIRTIAIFNRLLREEKAAAKPDWVNLATCYAAFSEQNPEIVDDGVAWRMAPEPILRLEPKGSASIRIATVEPEAQSWELNFAPSGRLLSASSSVEKVLQFQPVPSGAKPIERVVPQGSPQMSKRP